MSASETGGIFGRFPTTRFRRNRQHEWLREMVAETSVSPQDLVWPLFVHDKAGREPVTAMPGVNRLAIDDVVQAASEAKSLGIPAIALFPVIDQEHKTADGQHAVDSDNLVCRTIQAVRAETGNDVGIICDVALDPYTTHGHDGLLENGHILNDETVTVLQQQAVVLAQAGCHIIAPSDMMDGRVGAIRDALDKNHHDEVGILAYAAKYASAYYGPFRDALGSHAALDTAKSLGVGDKKTYQMNPANSDEAVREVAFDLDEGADLVMVKPAITCLDIIYRVKKTFGVPTLAYQVSGEYAMIQAAATNGWLDGQRAAFEAILAIKRAGADAILTYFAPQIARQC
jgi:porphobilinogen synthase